MPDRYPGYDVMAKRHTPSWNEATRRAIDHRLSLPRTPHFFTEDEWLTLGAICDRIVPQPKDRPPIPVPAMIDHKLTEQHAGRLSQLQAAAVAGSLAARPARARTSKPQARHGGRFHAISIAEQNALLKQMQDGELDSQAWGDMPCKLFFKERMVHDIVVGVLRASDLLERDRLRRSGQSARLCAHGLRQARSVGSGGSQAGTRGQRRGGRTAMLDDAMHTPRGKDGRAPDPLRVGGWMPMREYPENEPVDFVIVGTGAGGGTLACKLAEYGFSVVALRCRRVVASAGGIRLRRGAPAQAVLDRRAHLRRRKPAEARLQQQRQGGRRQHGAFRHGVAALPPGALQDAQQAGLRRGLAAGLARDVGLLHRSRGCAEDLRPGELPLGTASPALSVPSA